MTKSPWSISDRQNRDTSREHAFCSLGVPLRCCWAMAPVETDTASSVSAKKNFRIVFLRRDRGIWLEGRLARHRGGAQPKRRVIIAAGWSIQRAGFAMVHTPKSAAN